MLVGNGGSTSLAVGKNPEPSMGLLSAASQAAMTTSVIVVVASARGNEILRTSLSVMGMVRLH
jgi:hypothetical protein